ncbi:MAG: hypothetical protein SGPRY_001369 [Prymnesium sp.]
MVDAKVDMERVGKVEVVRKGVAVSAVEWEVAVLRVAAGALVDVEEVEGGTAIVEEEVIGVRVEEWVEEVESEGRGEVVLEVGAVAVTAEVVV